MTVLVVEDDVALQQIFAYTLRQFHCDVVFASNGEEAVAYLERHVPALIFLDIRLPYLSGEAVLDYLSNEARFRHTRVVTMSATQQYATLPNVREFVLKPIMPKRIMKVVEETLTVSS